MSDGLAQIAKEIRKHVVRMHRRGSNVGSAMSSVDILTALYFCVMNLPAPNDLSRDRFILSKGHAAAALYGTLAEKGFLDPLQLDEFAADGSLLAGHPVAGIVPGVEVSTGSLGHGLPIAAGMGLAAIHDGQGYRIFVLMGCGEMQEGTVWEGAMLCSALALDNVVVVVDANGLQGYGRTEALMSIQSIKPKLESFGWAVREVDGHDHDALVSVLSEAPFAPGKPSAIVARTVMGKGIAEMEGRLEWHYFNVPDDKIQKFLDELDGRA